MQRLLSLFTLAVLITLPAGATGATTTPRPLTLLFAGDVMLSRHVDEIIQRQRNQNFPWEKIAARTKAADLFFVNLEAPFSKTGPYDNGDMVFAVRPEYVTGLVQAGVDVVSLANNHYRDAGEAGVALTKRLLARQRIQYVLPGHPTVLNIRGAKIGLAGSAYNLGLDAQTLRQDIAKLKKREATFIVASMHAGTEYAKTPSKAQRDFAHAAVDAGANLVVGHHPHVTQTTERYRKGFIVYSLGNFIFDQFWSAETMRGAVLEVRLRSDGRFTPKLLPVSISRKAQPAIE